MRQGMRPETPWIIRFHSRPTVSLRLFCFPYAGGSASIFQPWTQPGVLPSAVEVCAIELPGRGSRQQEPALTRFSDLIAAATDAMLPSLQDGPFALFGHSLGALLSFEVARHLQNHIGLVPRHLFVSGCGAPQPGDIGPDIADVPALMTYLRGLGATPNKQMLLRRWPRFQADFALRTSYRYITGVPPLACPITVFGGTKDGSVNQEALAAWQEHTLQDCTVYLLPGDHFFLHRSQDVLLRHLENRLLQALP